MEDRCVCCGEIIPEGNMTCVNCREKYNRFKLAMPDDILTKGFAHVFFTRPDCNILTESNKLTSKVYLISIEE